MVVLNKNNQKGLKKIAEQGLPEFSPRIDVKRLQILQEN